jgi:predicted Rossmann-fold nucleotide-binding protein
MKAGGKSVGLNIYLPHEQKGNIYIDPDKLITFDYFFVRKVILFLRRDSVMNSKELPLFF